ncbi:hypothetical protein EB796_020165 [Bugula neritina]|uniref:Uncharacterized protein n=1 Tax=Bugula neritina TaxID=10212 RepID=A0A7J7J7J7_BUGNE|nr:hypothetical protein EB796_020165 [Bugula neritina]
MICYGKLAETVTTITAIGESSVKVNAVKDVVQYTGHVSTLAAPADVLVEVKRVRLAEVVTISQEEHAQSVPSLY